MRSDPTVPSLSAPLPAVSIRHDEIWARQAEELPKRVVVADQEWDTERLSQEARVLLAIYLADLKIVAQQREILALAELGLAQISHQFQQAAASSSNAA